MRIERHERGGRVIFLTDGVGAKKLGGTTSACIALPDVDPFVAPILHAIPAMGNKFHLANETGPAGQQNTAKGEYRGSVRLYFGETQR